MRETVQTGDHVESSLVWDEDDPIQPGFKVEATDGHFGVVRQRRRGEGPEHAYLGVETDEGLLFIPDRLIRETSLRTVFLSLPAADVKAHAAHGDLPVQPDPTSFPVEGR